MWPVTRREVMAGLPLALTATSAVAAAPRFDESVVARRAQALAAAPYRPPAEDMPAALARIDYDTYRAIRFRAERAIWSGTASPFKLQMFHRGFLHRDRVDMFEVVDGEARPIRYAHDLFRFDAGDPGSLPANLGFAGFRIHGPINSPAVLDEIAVFLGASYFRAVPRGGQYGLSARGLAIGSGEPGEEFPRFSAFWIERPRAGAKSIVVHALMDSISLAGAYRFEITPGADTVFDVTARLYPRKPLANAGIAPLTSMFLFGTEQPRKHDDFRPEVHDSDGLLIANGAGERLWRPLVNPDVLQVSDFRDNGPRGFGLMQRRRSLEAYYDYEARYDLRPSLWVEAQEGFTAGPVRLVELHAKDETEDNIVAFWRPGEPLAPGREHLFRYRLRWGFDPAKPAAGLAVVGAWREGKASTPGRPTVPGRRFVLDYPAVAGADFSGVRPSVGASAGVIREINAHQAPGGGLRLTFEFDPGEARVSELRAALQRQGRTISEVWMYRWLA
jgi:glucans biosynthesis protein